VKGQHLNGNKKTKKAPETAAADNARFTMRIARGIARAGISVTVWLKVSVLGRFQREGSGSVTDLTLLRRPHSVRTLEVSGQWRTPVTIRDT
jgi:hypothetical protein